MSCYHCMGWHWRNRKYCPNCRPPTPVNTPDKTVLVIRAPRTAEQEEKMNAAIARYRSIKPVFVFSSPVPEVEQVARRIADSFGVTVQVSLLLKAGRGLNPRAIELLLPTEKGVGLYIFMTHAPHVKLAYREWYRTFYCVSRPAPIEVAHGDVLLVDFTARVVRKL